MESNLLKNSKVYGLLNRISSFHLFNPVTMRIFLCTVLTFLLHYGSISAQSADDLLKEGTALHKDGKHADALTKLDQAIAANAGLGEAYFVRGKVKSAQQNDAGALTDYNKAAESGFSSGELYRLKAMSEHLTGNKTQACADFDKAIALGDALAGDFKDRFCK